MLAKSPRPDGSVIWRSRLARLARLVVAVTLITCAGCRNSQPERAPATSNARANTVVSSIRAEPRSFNRYATRDLTGVVIAYLTQGALVRINRQTDQLEPELAERWELLPDGRTYRLTLRRGLRFSDGQPFSSDDVVFSFRALYDPRGGILLADALKVRGEPLMVHAEDAHTVILGFPSPFGPGLRILDGVPIIPRHRLERALAEGQFASAWGVSTPPSELAGLGPFLLQRYDPGERLVFDRNPHYWRRDADGRALPSVDHVVLDIVSQQDTEQLRLASGDLDFTQSELRPSDYAPLKDAEAQGRVTVTDLGVGRDADLLWFNLTPALRTDKRAPWLRHVDFRRAVSHAVDRRAFIDTVYLGAGIPASGVISPENQRWYTEVPAPTYDLAAARARLASLGLIERDGQLEDTSGVPVRFSLLTQQGNTSLERGAAMIRDSLAPLGIRVDVVALEVGAVIERFSQGDYDAVYFRLLTTDTDPALNQDFWLSSGSAHVWHPSQTVPATTWEREIDRLMHDIAIVSDHDRRRALFAEVQRIMGREVPVLTFAFPKLWFALNQRVARATPAPFRPPILWNPAVISLRADAR